MLRNQTPKYKGIQEGHQLWPELNRMASQKVDQILQFGQRRK